MPDRQDSAPEQIRQTIQQLAAAEGAELSITAIRERLGTEQAQATQTAALLQAEVERLLAEGQKAVENLTAWVERATKAETMLEALERAKTETAGRRDE